MNREDKSSIDFTDREKAVEKLQKLKKKAKNDDLRRDIERKQASINKPVCK